MPCRQVSTYNGTTGSGQSGGGGYATEAECLQACKEGACCEGTSCSVKPQCQCQCTSGSCCGPDTFTNSNGETGPRCRNESQSACAARGGTWRCGVSCVGLTTDPNAGAPLGSGVCTSLASSTPSPVFKGVGTTCSPSPCVACSGCTASHPTYLNITFTQTAPISGGFHESLIDLSGTYSVPSVSTDTAACFFSGVFSKTYPSAVVNQFGTFDLELIFRVSALFASSSKAIAIGLAGASMDAGDVANRAAGIYQFTVSTGVKLGAQSFTTDIPLGADQMQSFVSCVGNSHTANRQGWTNAPTSSNPYRVNVNTTSVQCGSFSWAKV